MATATAITAAKKNRWPPADNRGFCRPGGPHRARSSKAVPCPSLLEVAEPSPCRWRQMKYSDFYMVNVLKQQYGSLQRFMACVRFRPFATDSPEDRARERIRKASLTTLAAMLARVISMLTPLITVPLTFQYLGLERYGMWQTIASFAGFLAFADLGVGNGIVSRIAQADGRGDRDIIVQTISTAFILLAGVAVLLIILYGATASFVPWDKVFNVKTPLAIAEASPAMTVFIVCFVLSLPISIVQKVQLAHQDGFNSYLWQCLGNLTGLGVVCLAVSRQFSLPILMLGMMGAPLLVTGLNGVDYFAWRKPWLLPRRRYFNKIAAWKLLGASSSFLAISTLTSAGMGADNIIAAQLLGTDAVAQLSVPARMAIPLAVVGQMLYLPMWGAYAEAIGCGEVAWVRQSVAKLTKLTVLFTAVGALILVIVGPWAVGLLTRQGLQTNYFLLAGLGVWAIMVSACGPSFMVLNAAHVLRPQICMYSAFLLLSVSAKLLLAKHFGIDGIVWAGVAIYPLVVFFPLRVTLNKTLKRLAVERNAHRCETTLEIPCPE